MVSRIKMRVLGETVYMSRYESDREPQNKHLHTTNDHSGKWVITFIGNIDKKIHIIALHVE